MKKLFALAALAAALLPICSASAQLQKTTEVIEPAEKIYSAHMGMLRLSKFSLPIDGEVHDSYDIQFFATGNRFDSGAVFCIGETAEQAILTLKDMRELFDTMKINDAIYVNDASGREVRIQYRKVSGYHCLFFKIPGIAGSNCNVSRQDVEKMIEKLQAL